MPFSVLSSYVNHSCAPNCVAEVVTFDKEDKIIIISSRRIPKGEEVRRLNQTAARCHRVSHRFL